MMVIAFCSFQEHNLTVYPSVGPLSDYVILVFIFGIFSLIHIPNGETNLVDCLFV